MSTFHRDGTKLKTCLTIDSYQWIDGINYPQWGRDDYQLYDTKTVPFLNMQKYAFSTTD